MIQLLLRISKKIVLILREKKVLAYAGVYILVLWSIATLVFHYVEKVELFDSLYWVITTTTTVGYGDITPNTAAGKAISIAVMLSGIGVLGIFLASIADILIEQSLRRRHIRIYMENHVIVLGWNKKLETAVKELLREGMEVAVLADVDNIPVEHDNLVFVKGDPTDDEDLARLGVEKAAFALISGKDDTETLLAAIAVKKMNENIQVTCVVSDPKVKKALEKIEVDQVISVDEFFGLVLSRSVFVPKVSILLNEIMATKGMDMHQEKIPGLKGKSVSDAIKELKEKYNAIPLGIVRKGRVIVNPAKDEKLEGDEEIIYVAETRIAKKG
jgi:voltage-gated potassium channel